MGNATVSEAYYLEKLCNEKRYSNPLLAQARKQRSFRNEAEEQAWFFMQSGYEVVRIQGFDREGNMLEEMVTFLVRRLPSW